MTDTTTNTDFHSLIAKEDNLLVPTHKGDRYTSVIDTVRRVMQRNDASDVFVAISALETQDSAVRLCQDVYEDACTAAESAFTDAIANMDEPWSDLVEQAGIDPTEWVDEDTLQAACELDILDSWRIPMAKVLAEYLFFFDGSVEEALNATGQNLRD
jgi:hypothetical protein